MKTKPACTTCLHVLNCKKVTEERLVTGYSCREWQTAPEVDLKARRDIMEDFGSWALRFSVPHLKPQSVRRRRK